MWFDTKKINKITKKIIGVFVKVIRKTFVQRGSGATLMLSKYSTASFPSGILRTAEIL
jgi:hypothetical protein